MKPYMSRLVASLLFFFSTFTLVFAEEEPISDNDREIPFPFPAGPVIITNGYQGTYTHQGKSKYALDMVISSKDFKNGCDQYGVPVIASRGGVVAKAINAGENGSFGTHLIIKSEKNIHIWYAHMIENSLQVELGEKVEQGQLLGLMGDTGLTIGGKCPSKELRDGNAKKYTKALEGVHLHTEMRKGMYGENKDGKWIDAVALKFNALLGNQTYRNITKGTYQSNSLLTKDKNDYWNKMKDYFAYNLPENAVGNVSTNPYKSSNNTEGTSFSTSKEKSSTQNSSEIISLSPNQVNEDEMTTFTITGKNLPSNLDLDLNVCKNNLEWIGTRGSEKQKFMCKIDLPGTTMGFITVPNQKTSEGQSIKMGFEIHILAKGEKIGKTSYTGFPEVPGNADPGDKINLSVTGQNLPPDLIFEAPFCFEIRYISRGLERQVIQCKISEYSYDKSGKLKNEIISEDIQVKNNKAEIVTRGDLALDHRLQIESITPPVAYFGQKTSFTLKGKNVHLLKTFYLDECKDMMVFSQSTLKDQVVIQCTLPIPEKFFSPLMPDNLKRKTLNLHVKDKPGGEMILAGKIEAMAFPESLVLGMEPYYPHLEENTKFTIRGNHLPEKLLYWLADCGQSEVIRVNKDSSSFTCKPAVIGSNALKNIELKALKAKENPQDFIQEIEKQRRLVEIKYPREYSEDGKKAIVLYRDYFLPIPKKYEDLYFHTLKNLKENVPNTLWLDPQDDEEIISYILKNEGNYSNTFLKKLGWKNTGSGTKPIYELLNCPEKLSRESTVHKKHNTLTSHLNISGDCAKALNTHLVEAELERMYPDKN